VNAGDSATDAGVRADRRASPLACLLVSAIVATPVLSLPIPERRVRFAAGQRLVREDV